MDDLPKSIQTALTICKCIGLGILLTVAFPVLLIAKLLEISE
jgi:hypothetical protein